MGKFKGDFFPKFYMKKYGKKTRLICGYFWSQQFSIFFFKIRLFGEENFVKKCRIFNRKKDKRNKMVKNKWIFKKNKKFKIFFYNKKI